MQGGLALAALFSEMLLLERPNLRFDDNLRVGEHCTSNVGNCVFVVAIMRDYGAPWLFANLSSWQCRSRANTAFLRDMKYCLREGTAVKELNYTGSVRIPLHLLFGELADLDSIRVGIR